MYLYSYSYSYSYSCISIHIHVFISIFMYLYSYSCISIHIHVFIFIFMLYLFIFIFLYSYSCIYIHIHLFIFTFIYLYSHSCYIFYIQVFIFTFIVMYAWFCSFICMVYFHGTRECECITSEVHIHIQPTKTILCEFNNSRQRVLVWSSCLYQPRIHLKFPDDVMPSITRILAIILHGQINGSVGAAECRSLLHQGGHRFGPPSAHTLMFVIFSVVRFSLALCASTLTQASDKKKITCQTMALMW